TLIAVIYPGVMNALAMAPTPGPPKVTLGVDVYPDPGFVRVTSVTALLVTADVAVAWTPPTPGGPMVTEGAEVYPEPGFVTEIETTEPFWIVDVNVAPVPVPPTAVIVGGEVYPLPEFVMVMS